MVEEEDPLRPRAQSRKPGGEGRQVRSLTGPGLTELRLVQHSTGWRLSPCAREGLLWADGPCDILGAGSEPPAVTSKPELPAHTVAWDQSSTEGHINALLLRVSFRVRDLESEPNTCPTSGTQ